MLNYLHHFVPHTTHCEYGNQIKICFGKAQYISRQITVALNNKNDTKAIKSKMFDASEKNMKQWKEKHQ